MKKLFHAIVLFLLSGVAYASSSAVTDPAITNHTDLSINYLEQIFGTVGNVLHGTSGQMLGQLFYKLNEGIVVVAGLWLAYTVFTIVLRSAQEGSFMGANKNVALAFLKIALGFALLIPNPATGYSVLQDIVMKVVVAGVGLADTTWRYGLDYVQNGGTLWPDVLNGKNNIDEDELKDGLKKLGAEPSIMPDENYVMKDFDNY